MRAQTMICLPDGMSKNACNCANAQTTRCTVSVQPAPPPLKRMTIADMSDMWSSAHEGSGGAGRTSGGCVGVRAIGTGELCAGNVALAGMGSQYRCINTPC